MDWIFLFTNLKNMQIKIKSFIMNDISNKLRIPKKYVDFIDKNVDNKTYQINVFVKIE